MTLLPLDGVVLLPELCDIAVSVLNLASDSWRQISLPCVPPLNARSAQDVFGGDLKGTYGADWAVYSYDAVNNGYKDVGLNGTLKQGVGYWAAVLAGGEGVELRLEVPVE